MFTTSPKPISTLCEPSAADGWHDVECRRVDRARARRQAHAARLLAAEQDGELITVPAVLLTEWWRGDNARQRAILEAVDIEPVDEQLGKLAGEAITALPGATAIDALVMASAAQRGDVVYTSDFKDLDRLQTHFRSIHRVLRV